MEGPLYSAPTLIQKFTYRRDALQTTLEGFLSDADSKFVPTGESPHANLRFKFVDRCDTVSTGRGPSGYVLTTNRSPSKPRGVENGPLRQGSTNSFRRGIASGLTARAVWRLSTLTALEKACGGSRSVGRRQQCVPRWRLQDLLSGTSHRIGEGHNPAPGHPGFSCPLRNPRREPRLLLPNITPVSRSSRCRLGGRVSDANGPLPTTLNTDARRGASKRKWTDTEVPPQRVRRRFEICVPPPVFALLIAHVNNDGRDGRHRAHVRQHEG